MRKFVLFLLIVALTALLAACSETKPQEEPTALEEAQLQVDVAENGQTEEPQEEVLEFEPSGNTAGVDIDLTIMTDEMAGTVFHNVMMNIDEHLGYTIRIRGPHESFLLNNDYIHFIFIGNADGGDDVEDCCGSVIEFVFDDELFQRPQSEDIVEVTGVLTMMLEEDFEFVVVMADSVVVVD